MRALVLSLALAWPGAALAEAVEATRPLPRGTVIEAYDVSVVPRAARRGEAVALAEVVGMEVRSTIRAGQGVRLSSLRAPVVVRRNQMIQLVYRVPAMSISAEGRALDAGGEGERVRVMNLDSRRIVRGLVVAPGIVEAMP